MYCGCGQRWPSPPGPATNGHPAGYGLHLAGVRLEDDAETVVALLRLVNLVAEQIICEPQALDDMYASLPEGKRQAIARCDSPSPEAE